MEEEIKELKNKEIFEEKGQQLFKSMIRGHPFLDGNKRIGILAMLIFLDLNEKKLNITNKKIISLVFEIAKGNEN